MKHETDVTLNKVWVEQYNGIVRTCKHQAQLLAYWMNKAIPNSTPYVRPILGVKDFVIHTNTMIEGSQQLDEFEYDTTEENPRND